MVRMLLSRARFLIVVVAALMLSAAQPVKADWGAPTFFSTAKQYEILTQWVGDLVEGPDGVLHAVWTDYDRTSDWPATAVIALRYARSTDGGSTWSPAITVTSTNFIYSGFYSAKLALNSSGRIHLTYHYLNYYGYSTVNYAKSDDQGQTWTSTYFQGGCFPWYATPALDSDGNVYVAWERWKCNRSTLPNMVFFSRSLDQGTIWEVPTDLAEGGVMPGWILTADTANRLHLIYEGGGDVYSPGYGQPHYARSDDRGSTWQISPVGPEGFTATGIFSSAGTLLIPGYIDSADVFLRSTDGGNTWGDPQTITGLPSSYSVVGQIAVDGQGTYHTWKDQSFVSSNDGGRTWSDPDYMGNGSFAKLLITRAGRIVALGQFPCSATDSCVGMSEYHEPFGVDAPAFASYWEKASFRYPFSVRGTGVVKASFPAAAVDVSAHAAVQVGSQTVPASVAVEGDRLIISFPVASDDWVNCSIPVYVKKGVVEKRSAIKAELARLDKAFIAAADAEDGERVLQIDFGRSALRAELASSAQEVLVSILDNETVKATDKTLVSIYERVTAVYVHLKADPRNNGSSDLLLKTADAVTVRAGEPFMLEVKVTHLKAGQTAKVSLTGSFSTIDRIETNATGTHQTTFYVFYPQTSTLQNQVITMNVDINGVTSSVPVTVMVM